MNREKNLETCIVIMTGLLVLWFIYQNQWFLIAALILGIIGAFFDKLASWVNWFWYKIAEVMGGIMSKVLLSLIFFLFLFPIAFLYRLFNADGLQLKKKSNGTYWTKRNKKYTKKDLSEMW